MLIRKTGRSKGRNQTITPQNTPLQVLSCGRILLDSEVPEAEADSGGQEVSLICLKGKAKIEIGSEGYSMQPYDTLYIPPGHSYRVTTDSATDLVEASAPCPRETKIQLVPFRNIKDDPQFHFTAGAESSSREVFKLLDTNVDASRLLCGVTFGQPGHWTGWSPHEHASSREEVYLYINMPSPAFGLQMIYHDLENPEVVPVFEDDAFVITEGYHPNVGIPGHGINYVWMMAGLRPQVDRGYSDMHFQKEFVQPS